MAFLAYLAAIGLLTMKGMVESVEDPLLYSDDQLIGKSIEIRSPRVCWCSLRAARVVATSAKLA